jgi:hypothetical protein
MAAAAAAAAIYVSQYLLQSFCWWWFVVAAGACAMDRLCNAAGEQHMVCRPSMADASGLVVSMDTGIFCVVRSATAAPARCLLAGVCCSGVPTQHSILACYEHLYSTHSCIS